MPRGVKIATPPAESIAARGKAKHLQFQPEKAPPPAAVTQSEEESIPDGESDIMSRSSAASSVNSAQLLGRVSAMVAQLQVRGADGRLLNDQYVIQGVLESISRAIRTMAPMAILVMDTECNIVDVNPKAEEMFGRPSVDLQGRNIKMIMPSEIAAKHDGFVASYLNKYEQKRKPPKSNIVGSKEGREVLAVRMVQGKPITFNAKVAVRGIPHPAGKHLPPLFFIGYLEDVTERRKLQEALEINAFIREKGDTAMIVMTDYGKILDFNQASADLFRYNRKFIVGQNVIKLMPPEIAAIHDEKLEAYRERVSTGMLHTSAVVGKARQVVGYRPKFDNPGFEEFPLELRVECFSGGKVLVAFVKDMANLGGGVAGEGVSEDSYPPHTHDRLLAGEPVWDSHPIMTVLFAEILDFKSVCEGQSAGEVFEFVHGIVSAFDELGYGMQKVRTMGDGYMAFFENADDAILTGLKMIEHCMEEGIALRVGINSGEVISGVVGTTRKTFDMWGDAVKMASLMEINGVVNQVHISGETYDEIENEELRGVFAGHTANIKDLGRIGTYVTDLPHDHTPNEIVSLLADRDIEERSKEAALNMKGQS